MTEAHPTFSWVGLGKQEETRVCYDSFQLSGELYSVGDCAYLLPMEEGAPPYIAKLTKAYVETAAVDAEKLVIEVQWFERRSSVPPGVGALMSEAEVVESDLRCTNLVGCIDSKAVIVRADSYTQACELLPASKRQGEWYFCRGMLLSEIQQFKTYKELGQHVYGEVIGILHRQQQQPYMMYPLDGGYSDGHVLHLGDGDLSSGAVSPMVAGGSGRHTGTSSGGPAASSAANSRSRRAAAAARVAAAAAAAAGGGGNHSVRGVPGKVCCECGATQTPQWREGPLGPKTLCNACGVRYQRSQSKAKSNKRTAADKCRGSPLHGRAPKQACLSRLSANSSAAAAMSPTADIAIAGDGFTSVGLDLSNVGHSHGTRSNAGRGIKQQQQPQHRNGLYLGGEHASSGGHHRTQQQQHQRGGGSHGDALHYYVDEGSPPNVHTHILEEADDGDEGLRQQLPLSQTLNRTATYEAADTLQSLSAQHHQQQHQQVAAAAHHAVSAAFCNSSAISSPSSNMLSDQLQAADMPLLSLDDKDVVLTGLGGPDGLDAGLSAHSLSPIKPRAQQLTPSAATHGSRRPGAAASAVCASPGRLIAAMVQGLKLPTPLSLNTTVNHHSAASATSAPPLLSLLPNLTVSTAAPATSAPPSAAGAACGWASVTGNGQLLPVIGSSSNLTPSSGTTPTAAAAAAAALNSIAGMPGSMDCLPTSAAVSSCGTAGAAAGGSNGLAPTGFGTAAHCQLQQHGSIGNSNSCMLSQLRSLVFRASSYAPDVQGLGGLYPGPSTPRAMHNLVHQLEQLPQTARVQLQRVSAVLEDSLSKAKAADAAVIAVTQVLAAKKQAAADARQEVENSISHLKQMLGQVSPSVAAAAAGNGSSSTYCSPVPTPVAADPGRCCMTSVGTESLLPPASVTAAGLLASGCCGSGDCLVGSSRLGANSPRVLVTQCFSSHPTQGFDLSTDNLGSSVAAVDHVLGHNGAGDNHSDADDMLRDPEESAGAAAMADLVGLAGTFKQQQQVEVKQEGMHHSEQQQQQLGTELDRGRDRLTSCDQQNQQECSATGNCCNMQTAGIELLPAVNGVQQVAAMAVDQQQQHVEAVSASGSTDGPTVATAAKKQPRLGSNSLQLKTDCGLGAVRQPAAVPTSLPPTSAAHPAAEAAFVAA